jgi:hypothetical protein
MELPVTYWSLEAPAGRCGGTGGTDLGPHRRHRHVGHGELPGAS